MRTSKSIHSLFLVIAFIVLSSCSKEKAGQGIMTSAYGDTSSHDVGTACLSCHNSGGSNSYWWSFAGTVYEPNESDLNPNGTIYLFTSVNGTGTLIAVLPIDAKGNFYTSNLVSFSSGLYPGVKSASGETRYMQSSTKSGDCNSCHISLKRIIVN
ncbi:MAG: hypothetical protein ABSD71_07010 [Bacteroidales bacterium]